MLKKDKMTADMLRKKQEVHKAWGMSASPPIDDYEAPDPFGYFKGKYGAETFNLKQQAIQEKLNLQKQFDDEKIALKRLASEEKVALKRQAAEEKSAFKIQAAKEKAVLQRQASEEKAELKKQASIEKLELNAKIKIMREPYQEGMRRKVSLGLGQLNPKKKTIFSRVKRALGFTKGTPKKTPKKQAELKS